MDVITSKEVKQKDNNKQQTFDLGSLNTNNNTKNSVSKPSISNNSNSKKPTMFEKNREDSINLLNNLSSALKTNKMDMTLDIDKKTYLSFTKSETKKTETLVEKDSDTLSVKDLSKNMIISHISFGKGTIEKVKGNFVYIIFEDQTEAKMFRADKLIERNLIKKIS